MEHTTGSAPASLKPLCERVVFRYRDWLGESSTDDMHLIALHYMHICEPACIKQVLCTFVGTTLMEMRFCAGDIGSVPVVLLETCLHACSAKHLARIEDETR